MKTSQKLLPPPLWLLTLYNCETATRPRGRRLCRHLARWGVVAALVLPGSATGLRAQANEPLKLALVSESTTAAAAVDVLTAELSHHPALHLLERTEIERVYREQGLSAATADGLRLGRLLGADGVMLVSSVAEGANAVLPPAAGLPIRGGRSVSNNLETLLLAVKPGVILGGSRAISPDHDLAAWAKAIAARFAPDLPKLGVLAKDALPISVVNLRAAIDSAQSRDLERQLTRLVIQRLAHERNLFVLERRHMELLSAEKDLKLDDSAFWSGAYLLEGVVDQAGYSKDVVSLDVRLVPPKGGQPILLKASGSRTNLPDAVNQLAGQVVQALKLTPTLQAWNPAEEAARYFQEAQWALRWGLFDTAQAAAESAWALGKKDRACAILRIKAYTEGLSANVGKWLKGEYRLSSAFDANGKPLGPTPSDAEVTTAIRSVLAENKHARIVRVSSRPGTRTILYAWPTKLPSAEDVDRAILALRLYEDFCRSAPEAERQFLIRGNGRNDSHNYEWYQTGLDDLAVASKVLQSFNFRPEAKRPAADKLAELRALARAVAQTICTSPSVRESYFVGERMANHDELAPALQEHDSIFRCKLNWGGYWQEKPEDHLALYRELLASPVFCYIHSDFWSPKPPASHLVAWTPADEQRLPALWKSFITELGNSTNVLWRMESKALLKAEAPDEAQAQAAEAGWWSLVRSNRQQLVGHNVELFYLGWGFSYNAETKAMDQEYWHNTIPARNSLGVFEQQKRYLASFAPYAFGTFCGTFQSQDYTKAQAAELLPLIAAYKSNLLARVPTTAVPSERAATEHNVKCIEQFLEQRVSRALNSPARAPSPVVSKPPPVLPATPQPASTVTSVASAPISSPASPQTVSHILLVSKFLPIPLDRLPGESKGACAVTAHRWLEGKLVLDLQYGAFVYAFDQRGNWESTRNAGLPAIATLDPTSARWQVIPCPEQEFSDKNHFYHRTTLFHGEVFTSDGGRIRRYDAASNSWQVLECPEVGNCELFTVHDRLYAVTENLIVELLDRGARTQILASNRRQPPLSALDTEHLGTPALFAGPDHSLRAYAASRIFAWNGTDWRMLCSAPQTPAPPVISDEGVLFTANGWNGPAGVWRLSSDSDRLELCLAEPPRNIGRASASLGQSLPPAWKMPPGLSFQGLPTASRGPDLFLLVDHAKSENLVDEAEHLIVGKKILPQDGYHAQMLCLASNYSAPQEVLLRFNAEDTSLPVSGDQRLAGRMAPIRGSAWLSFSANYAFFGKEVLLALPSGGGDPKFKQPQEGVWMLPLEQLDAAIASQRQAQKQQQLRPESTSQRARVTLPTENNK